MKASGGAFDAFLILYRLRRELVSVVELAE
jgi:hypothetical protein